ncbi:MAG: redoxin domain-containing protein [Proteobacteria bacterium]|nr:redoxin domain-containing protein [Pseudomonadota bacterium]
MISSATHVLKLAFFFLTTTALIAPTEALASAPLSHIQIGALAPDFTAMGSDGRQHHLSDYRGSSVVLEWTSPVCPYVARKYGAQVMQKLQRYAHNKKVVWLSIDTANSSKPGFLTPEAANARIAKTGAIVSAFLFDTNSSIGRSYGARTTPGMYVVDAQGRLAYQGALDDVPETDHAVKRPYVRDAINDLSAGRQVATPETTPYGCAVEY